MGLRERNRRAAKLLIRASALNLFFHQGFEGTSVEQIAARAGVSRSTFFRYFETKEDVVLDDIAERGLLVRTALESRPPDEPALEALVAAVKTLYTPETAAESRELARMIAATPSLRARHGEKRRYWMDLLLPEVERRLEVRPGSTTDPRARALVACVLTCLDVATEMWSANDRHDDPLALFVRSLDPLGV